MDELTQYLKLSHYNEFELEEILNKKIIITKDHVDSIDIDYYWDECEFNIIKLFEKYGFIFTDDIYISLLNKNGNIIHDIPEKKRTNEIYKTAVRQKLNNVKMHLILFLIIKNIYL